MLLLDATGPIADPWRRIEGEAPLPADGQALIDLDRLEEAAQGGLTLGVHVPNTTDPHALVPAFPRLALISVEFPSFADGRGFSIGRCLRHLGWRGRMRATGPVIADQFGYLLQVGFDEVAVDATVAARQTADQWMAALGAVSLGYQRGVGLRGPILDRRHGGLGSG